jgi:hypothetical protein
MHSVSLLVDLEKVLNVLRTLNLPFSNVLH